MKATHTLLLSILLASASQAATIVQTQTYAFTPAGNQTLTFNEFDTQGGNRILNSVTINTSLTKSGGSLYVDNDSATPGSGSISQNVTINLTSAGVNLIDSSFQVIGNLTTTTNFFVSLAADDGDGLEYQSGGLDWGGTAFADQSVSQTSTVATLLQSSYEGSSTYTIHVGGTQGTSTSSISGAAGAFSPATASGYVTVTYNYTDLTPVPEPGSWMIASVALGAGVLFRRRRI